MNPACSEEEDGRRECIGLEVEEEQLKSGSKASVNGRFRGSRRKKKRNRRFQRNLVESVSH